MGLASKAKTVTVLIQKISSLRSDLQNNRAALKDLVITVNALIIPRGWVGLDDDGSIHVTLLSTERMRTDELPGTPRALSMSADYVWEYRPWARTVTNVKSRDGRWQGKTVRCIPPKGVVA